MTVRSITVTSNALKGTNKRGVLVPDENGYYDVVLGALEYKNSYGAIYKLTPAKKLLSESNKLMRQLEKQVLFGEWKHPDRERWMSDDEFMKRVHEIDQNKISHHIKEVTIDENMKDIHGNSFIGFRGKVKPYGPYGKYFEEAAKNPDLPLSFSIRSITLDTINNGIREKELLTIITWDLVLEAGLDVATKWNFPSLECYCEIDINEYSVENALNSIKESKVSTECATRLEYTLKQLSRPPKLSSKDKVWMNW